MANILVTGGCGYIGSHTIVELLNHDYDVTCLDSLVNSSENVMSSIAKITGKQVQNHRVDLCDTEALQKVFATRSIDGIIHFAALKNVGESVAQPLRYHRNNVTGMINLVDCAIAHKVTSFIFSSSCSVYGNPPSLPVTEATPLAEAQSPYGRTKQICEAITVDVAVANPEIKFINLRYFNPAGAHESLQLGESPVNPALNLVPIITETAIGKRSRLHVHGSDYPTRDGSCIRDYIHIMDLARAHVMSLSYLQKNEPKANPEIFNLGSGRGSTVLEVIAAFERVSQTSLNYEIGPRRPGDVEAIYADYEKARKMLGWSPKYDIEDIMRTAWRWEEIRNSQRLQV